MEVARDFSFEDWPDAAAAATVELVEDVNADDNADAATDAAARCVRTRPDGVELAAGSVGCLADSAAAALREARLAGVLGAAEEAAAAAGAGAGFDTFENDSIVCFLSGTAPFFFLLVDGAAAEVALLRRVFFFFVAAGEPAGLNARAASTLVE